MLRVIGYGYGVRRSHRASCTVFALSMRRADTVKSRRTFAIALGAMLVVWAACANLAAAKGGSGKGGNGNRGIGKAVSGKQGHGSSSEVAIPRSDRAPGAQPTKHAGHPGIGQGKPAVGQGGDAPRTSSDYRGTGRSEKDALDGRADTHHRSIEQRKLAHRLGTADHLDAIAQRNGNPHLQETADRMRTRANALYEKRLEAIQRHESGPDFGSATRPVLVNDVYMFAPPDVANGIDAARLPLDQPTRQFGYPLLRDPAMPPQPRAATTGVSQDYLDRQARQEESRLIERLQTAQRLHEQAKASGDSLLMDTARRVEQQALDQYENRIEALYPPAPQRSPVAGSPNGSPADSLLP